MSEARGDGGSAHNSRLGLVMVGGAYGLSSTEYTSDGATIGASQVADFGQDVTNNCVVSVNDTTLISFGGSSGTYHAARRQQYLTSSDITKRSMFSYPVMTSRPGTGPSCLR